ncbi:MAG: hypothetical protein IPK82_28505 [Polyangiaceae bacterium]|nr:hypothetical protein [Polyangiaceae bacterium]
MPVIFREVAQTFGLNVDAAGILGAAKIHGTVDGIRLEMASTENGLRAVVWFDPPLDLGLDISTRHFAFADSMGTPRFFGDSNWDDEIATTCDDPGRARKLLEGAVRRHVLKLNSTSNNFTMTDLCAKVEIALPYQEQLMSLVPTLIQLGKDVATDRLGVPPPRELKLYAKVLKEMAQKVPLQLSNVPLKAEGIMRETAIKLEFTRTGVERYQAELLAFPQTGAQREGFLVKPETLVDRARVLFGAQDVQVGDAPFDKAFLIQSGDPERAVAALDADVRALLLELRTVFDEVEIRGNVLAARGPSAKLPAPRLEAVLEAASTIVPQIARASGGVFSGPYR